MLLWLIVAGKAGHLATLKQRLAMANQRCVHRLADQVVAELDIGSRFRIVKEIKVVFPVGGRFGALIPHVRQPVIKSFALSGLQVVTPRENESVIPG